MRRRGQRPAQQHVDARRATGRPPAPLRACSRRCACPCRSAPPGRPPARRVSAASTPARGPAQLEHQLRRDRRLADASRARRRYRNSVAPSSRASCLPAEPAAHACRRPDLQRVDRLAHVVDADDRAHRGRPPTAPPRRWPPAARRPGGRSARPASTCATGPPAPDSRLPRSAAARAAGESYAPASCRSRSPDRPAMPLVRDARNLACRGARDAGRRGPRRRRRRSAGRSCIVLRLALHVHQADRDAAGGHGVQRARRPQRADVVDHRRARGDRRAHHGRLRRVDADDRHRRPRSACDHRQDARRARRARSPARRRDASIRRRCRRCRRRRPGAPARGQSPTPRRDGARRRRTNRG